jgi:ubiquinone/menaquinone biosynthesis C-methylase UbiE
MPLEVDTPGNEIRALQKAAEWQAKRVLEIGCGEGRLTLRLAALHPKHIEAVDPDAARVRQARRNLPGRYGRRITYHVGQAEHLKYPGSQFDIVIFSWAL